VHQSSQIGAHGDPAGGLAIEEQFAVDGVQDGIAAPSARQWSKTRQREGNSHRCETPARRTVPGKQIQFAARSPSERDETNYAENFKIR